MLNVRWTFVGQLAVATLVATSGCSSDEADPAACADTCESLGYGCGEVCGESCGGCGLSAEGRALDCVAGRCVCLPDCDGRSCRAGDGCGGTCGPCDQDVSCPDCPLRLVRVEHSHDGGTVTGATLAVELVPSGDAPPPRIGDLRIASDRPARLDRVERGPALIAANKALHTFTPTGRHFKQLDDGSYQVLVLPAGRNAGIGAGRWLTLHFTLEPDWGFSEGAEHASFWFVRRDQVLAPPAADGALQATPYDAPVVMGVPDAP